MKKVCIFSLLTTPNPFGEFSYCALADELDCDGNNESKEKCPFWQIVYSLNALKKNIDLDNPKHIINKN